MIKLMLQLATSQRYTISLNLSWVHDALLSG